jgi:N-acetylglutamate synthase-like GNAT family acetyltransferase
MQWSENGYTVDTNASRINHEVVVQFLRTSYWAQERPPEIVMASWKNSTVQFGLHDKKGEMVGGCRIISDNAAFAWLADVFVVPEHQGNGLGKFLIACVIDHPSVKNVEQVLLGTLDAQGLYAQFGWKPHDMPERLMARRTTSTTKPHGEGADR